MHITTLIGGYSVCSADCSKANCLSDWITHRKLQNFVLTFSLLQQTKLPIGFDSMDKNYPTWNVHASETLKKHLPHQLKDCTDANTLSRFIMLVDERFLCSCMFLHVLTLQLS